MGLKIPNISFVIPLAWIDVQVLFFDLKMNEIWKATTLLDEDIKKYMVKAFLKNMLFQMYI